MIKNLTAKLRTNVEIKDKFLKEIDISEESHIETTALYDFQGFDVYVSKDLKAKANPVIDWMEEAEKIFDYDLNMLEKVEEKYHLLQTEMDDIEVLVLIEYISEIIIIVDKTEIIQNE